MKTELEQKLAEEFPFMRRGKSVKEQQEESGRITDLYSAFGCDCGDGWYELLRNLCREITATCEAAGAPVDIIVDQVKEKFGGLRFYFHRKGRTAGIQAIDSMDGSSIRLGSKVTDLDRTLYDIVARYEDKSKTVCEKCGRPGTLRAELRWVLTLCDDCFQTRVSEMGERALRPKKEQE